jgi:hypothetical protein
MKTQSKAGNAQVRIENFGINDSRGREIGAQIYTYEETHTEISDEAAAASYSGYYTGVEPGLYFGFRPHATRNGSTYGALQHGARFATVAERDAAIEKYLAGARKRAAKAAK